jgi:hypothetical protein
VARQVKATCLEKFHPIAYSLDEPQQGGVGVLLKTGQTTYCGHVTGSSIVVDVPVVGAKPGSFRGKNGPAPTKCAPPPVSWP